MGPFTPNVAPSFDFFFQFPAHSHFGCDLISVSLVFVGRKKVVFLHGCFWHRHPGCPNTRLPKSNIEFWEKKLSQNVLHDKAVYEQLEHLGWNYMIIWECELKKSNRALLEEKIHLFMDGDTI